ncbi:hypothetical protein A2U01_0099093, partial [Trifolium medium]|nr:hypothetical protein [Trifolium medium]
GGRRIPSSFWCSGEAIECVGDNVEAMGEPRF